MDFTWRTQVVTLALTFVGGLATVLGGSLALLAGKPKPRKLGVMLGGSSGVMLYIAFADLIPYSALAIGHPYTWLFFVLGVVGSSLVMYYMPEPHFAGGDDNEDHGHSHGHGSREERSGCENAEARHGMTHKLLAATNGKVVLALEGGYNVRIIATCAEACIRALLGEQEFNVEEEQRDLDKRKLQYDAAAAQELMNKAKKVVNAVKEVHADHWPVLRSTAAAQVADDDEPTVEAALAKLSLATRETPEAEVN